MSPSEIRCAIREFIDRLKAGWKKNDPLLALRGSGKKLWADEHADQYAGRLREGCETRITDHRPLTTDHCF